MKGYLDDIALFLAVADAGGLGGAASATGVSTPTLSRRMAALERRLETRLFERGKRGYALTAAGRALLTEAEPLRAAAARLARWPEAETQPKVRITAGHWTTRFIAQNITQIWSPDAGWMPEFLASNARIDIARRQADIGVRNRPPDQPWLAGRRTYPVEYAAFARDASVTGYLVLTDGAPTTPTDRWVREHRADQIVTTASDSRLAADLALAGIGRVVLPTYAGATIKGLLPVDGIIEDLTHDEWIVAHHDARQDRPVRAALDALTALLTDSRLRPLSGGA